MKATTKLVRRLRFRAFLSLSEAPLIVYAAVLGSMALVWFFRKYHPDLTLNIFSELLGAAFTLFIIDTLLVRSKTKRWKVVREHINYLIARNINRIRGGVAARAFHFNPELESGIPEEEQTNSIREQRAELLSELEKLDLEQLILRLHEKRLFTENSYDYFNEKAEDIWNILNMKYSDYLAPDLVSCLIEIHTHLKDVCAHIRQYRKAEHFPENEEYYRGIGMKGASVSLNKILHILNLLKSEGYSEIASLTGEEMQYADASLGR